MDRLRSNWVRILISSNFDCNFTQMCFPSRIYLLSFSFRGRNPTPDSSLLPKWEEVKRFPIDFYRIGNFHFENKPTFGMESGGLFDDRMKFWKELGAHLPAKHFHKDEL